MGQVLTSATPVSRSDQTGEIRKMPCEECPGEGGCIPALAAINAYPDDRWAGNNQPFYDSIGEATCPEGNAPLEIVRRKTLDHAMRHEHKGGGGKRMPLPDAASRVALRRLGIRDEAFFEDLRDLALGRILRALNFVPGKAALYDFQRGTPFFGFTFAYLKEDVKALLEDRLLPIEARPPASYADLEREAEKIYDGIERRMIDGLWEAQVALDPKLLHVERKVLAEIGDYVKARHLKPKKRECLDRAMAIVGRALEGDKDHCVWLFGGAGPESDGAIFLAAIVSDDVGHDIYEHTNGATLTKGLPAWLGECIDICVDDANQDTLREVAELTRIAVDSRKHRQQVLKRIGERRSLLEDEAFSLKKWMGPARIETQGRVANDDLANSGQGIAAIDSLFGCVPPDSPALKRMLLAGGGGADRGGVE